MPADLFFSGDGVPPFFQCPISLQLMHDPVSLSTGVTYDRSSIQRWLDLGHRTCPATMQQLLDPLPHLTPNHTLRRLIHQWCAAHPSFDFRPSPSPPPPAQPLQVSLMLRAVASGNGRLAALQRLRSLAKASDGNRNCIQNEGGVKTLIDLIGSEALDSDPEFLDHMQEVLGILVLFQLDESPRCVLSDAPHLRLIARILQRGSIDARVSAAQLLEVACIDRSGKAKIGAHDEIIEGLIALLKENLYPLAVKAGLKVLVSLSQALTNRIKIVEMDAAATALELLPGAERSMAERVLALLDALAACAEGRASISRHALAVPGIVKCLLVVSELATEHAIGILWSICLHSSNEELLQETIQLGASKTLLVVMQMDFSQRTKQKAKEVLRLLSDISADNVCTSSEEI